MATVHQVIVQHLNALQSGAESSEADSCDLVRLVRSDLNKLNDVNLCADLEALSVTTGTHRDDGDGAGSTNTTARTRLDKATDHRLSQQVATALLKCLDCVLVSETTPPIDNSNGNSSSLFDLMAAIAVEYNVLEDTFYTLLHRASVAASDRVRLLACRMLVACVKQAPHSLTELVPILLPRLTDKTQSVRLAALLGAQACTQAAAGSEPPKELTEALLWNLHHDPSWTNRCQAIQSLALVAPTQIHHVIRRLRDVKSNVRVAAIERLHAVPLNTLTPDQCAEIVRAGFTDRYVGPRAQA